MHISRKNVGEAKCRFLLVTARISRFLHRRTGSDTPWRLQVGSDPLFASPNCGRKCGFDKCLYKGVHPRAQFDHHHFSCISTLSRTPSSEPSLPWSGPNLRHGAPESTRLGTSLSHPGEVQSSRLWKLLVRKGGLEPPWVTPPDPKSGASANSATFARRELTDYTPVPDGGFPAD